MGDDIGGTAAGGRMARTGWSRRLACVAVGVVLLVATMVRPGTVGVARAAPAAEAWIVVDVESGVVLDAHDARTARRPASTIKLFTALVAAQHLRPADAIAISERAAATPARKIDVQAGETWTFDDLLHAMLLVSANDAAVAIAEHLGGGSLDGWVRLAQATAGQLGMADDPQLFDPSGLDDELSHLGGSSISARDLAIATRALVVGHPEVLAVVAKRTHRFVGGDGQPHSLTNGNLFLDLYDGALGLKTGTTALAGRTFVAAATRAGRTLVAVVLRTADPYGTAAALLDAGFATDPATAGTGDRLPAVVPDAAHHRPDPGLFAQAGEVAGALAGDAAQVARDQLSLNSPTFAVPLAVVGLAALGATRWRLQRRWVRLGWADGLDGADGHRAVADLTGSPAASVAEPHRGERAAGWWDDPAADVPGSGGASEEVWGCSTGGSMLVAPHPGVLGEPATVGGLATFEGFGGVVGVEPTGEEPAEDRDWHAHWDDDTEQAAWSWAQALVADDEARHRSGTASAADRSAHEVSSPKGPQEADPSADWYWASRPRVTRAAPSPAPASPPRTRRAQTPRTATSEPDAPTGGAPTRGASTGGGRTRVGPTSGAASRGAPGVGTAPRPLVAARRQPSAGHRSNAAPPATTTNPPRRAVTAGRPGWSERSARQAPSPATPNQPG